jgi:two-component system, LytTR family, response regulator
MAERHLQMLGQTPNNFISGFTVQTGSRVQIVLAEDTDWIGAAGDYAELHGRGRSHLVRETMNSLQRKLDPTKFLRMQRSRFVRTACILELRALGNREHLVNSLTAPSTAPHAPTTPNSKAG